MVQVDITALSKRYGEVVAVDDIDLTVEDGTLTTLVGPSGCGKTTSLRCVAGLERPDSGSITIGDRVVTDLDAGVFLPAQERNIGFIFQNFDVWPHLTVFENIAYPLRIEDLGEAEIEERVDEMLALTSISELKHKDAIDLSGGQKARVSICRALVSEPDVLLCDEPLTGLDRNLRKQLRYEIRRLQSRLGITTIYVTHSQPEAMAISDTICLMNTSGRIEQVGTASEIFNSPVSQYAFDFFGASETLYGTVRGPSEVETPIGPIQGDAAAFASGEEVYVGVRPQDVHIGSDGGSPNRWTGTLDQLSFLGDVFELDITVDGTHIRSRLQHLPREFDEGESIDCYIDPDDVHLFARSEP